MTNKVHAVSIALLLCASSQAIGADGYSVSDLGTLGDAVAAAGINEDGVSVGYALDLLYRYHGWVNTNGVFDQVTGMGMNGQGQMLGINDFNRSIFASYMLGMLSTNAAIYDGSMPMMIGMMMPCAINNSDFIVGSRFVTGPTGLREEQACSWHMMNGIQDLPVLSGASSSIAKGLNDAGWIVGSSILPGSLTPTATLWHNGAASDLGTLGGNMSQAIAINAANQAVGISELANGETHAFRFDLDANGSVLARVDLGSLSGGYSIALAISDAGQIVGTSGNRAVLWENGKPIDLNSLIPTNSGWVLNKATGINESGQIVGVGSLGGDPFRAFVLTPTEGCVADLNGDGALDFFDVSALLTAYNSQDPLADLNNDGQFNFFDISIFLQAFQAGCP
ncbi:MAG: GC-type dockerin domain-anchored protein [Phycisphaerales bacterium]